MASSITPEGTRAVDLIALAGGASLAVGTTSTAYSQSFALPRDHSFGLEYQTTSSGVVSVQVDVEHSNNAPVTEGASDSNFVLGEGVAAVNANVADELVHFSSFAPVVCQYVRFKFTGLGANDATTVISRLMLNLSPNN